MSDVTLYSAALHLSCDLKHDVGEAVLNVVVVVVVTVPRCTRQHGAFFSQTGRHARTGGLERGCPTLFSSDTGVAEKRTGMKP